MYHELKWVWGCSHFSRGLGGGAAHATPFTRLAVPSCPSVTCYLLACVEVDTLCLPPLSACAIPASLPSPPPSLLPSFAGGLPARPTSLRATTTPASTCWRCPPSHKMHCLYRHTAGAVQGYLYWRTAGAVHRVHQRDDARVPRGGQNSCSSLCVLLFQGIELPSVRQDRSGPPSSFCLECGAGSEMGPFGRLFERGP